MVRIIKRILRTVLEKSPLNYEELLTVICEYENIINSPLTYVTEGIENLSPLSPTKLLKEVTETGIPELKL